MKQIFSRVFIIGIVIYALSKCNQGDNLATDNKSTATDTLATYLAPKSDYKADSIAKRKWDKSKAGKIQKKHLGWSDEDCIKIAAHEIWIGMEYDMLIYERGRPNKINTSNYGNGVQYQFCWDDYTPSFFYANDDQIIKAYN